MSPSRHARSRHFTPRHTPRHREPGQIRAYGLAKAGRDRSPTDPSLGVSRRRVVIQFERSELGPVVQGPVRSRPNRTVGISRSRTQILNGDGVDGPRLLRSEPASGMSLHGHRDSFGLPKEVRTVRTLFSSRRPRRVTRYRWGHDRVSGTLGSGIQKSRLDDDRSQRNPTARAPRMASIAAMLTETMTAPRRVASRWRSGRNSHVPTMPSAMTGGTASSHGNMRGV